MWPAAAPSSALIMFRLRCRRRTCPGEAEVDFGEFHAVIAGTLLKLWLFVLRLSCSGRAFHGEVPKWDQICEVCHDIHGPRSDSNCNGLNKPEAARAVACLNVTIRACHSGRSRWPGTGRRLRSAAARTCLPRTGTGLAD